MTCGNLTNESGGFFFSATMKDHLIFKKKIKPEAVLKKKFRLNLIYAKLEFFFKTPHCLFCRQEQIAILAVT
jgi:hypothetical protein